MNIMTCDGYPLLDTRFDELILEKPRVKTEVNTVGEGSFRIFFDHPHIDKLIPLRSIFEVSDEYGVFFRGRMTEDTKDFDNCKDVDLEGAMSYFNDSVVRPYVFPDDFEEDADYLAAVESGNVVPFYLGWLIKQHNEQVDEFQRFKLGVVTVEAKSLERSAEEYPSTWTELSQKTFNSSLGGNLCIRYEADGNYIDYLADFTEVNEQGIVYGENLLDISQNTNASETYSAIIPIGAEIESTESDGDIYEGEYGDIVGSSTVKKKLTLKDLDADEYPDGDIKGHDDIAKKGDTLYSKSAVAAYGWRYAPREETMWDDVTEAKNLLSNGLTYLEGNVTKIPNVIKVTAYDQNCTDSQIRSFRIYKKIPIYTPAHDVIDTFDLTALDRDLIEAQNTKITVGKTVFKTLTEVQNKQNQANSRTYATQSQVAQNARATEKLIDATKTIIMEDVASTYATSESVEASKVLDVVEDADGVKQSELNKNIKLVKFVAGQFIFEGTNFSLDEEGKIKATSGYIGEWLISNGELRQSFVDPQNIRHHVRLKEDGVFYQESNESTGVGQQPIFASWKDIAEKCSS